MCARGMLLTNISFDFVESDIALIDVAGWVRITEKMSRLNADAEAWLAREGVTESDRIYEAVIDARYVGQNFEVQVAMPHIDALDFETFEAGFHDAHLREYGYNVPDRAIEIINCRVKAIGTVIKAPLATLAASPMPEPASWRDIYFGARHGWLNAAVYDRDQLGAGAEFSGPVVFEEMSSTTVIAPGQHARVDEYGNIVVRIAG